ncbi:LysR family transcriptional regulator [Pseudonocardia xishanensis]|uniref:LysR family transcriptional regulator n=1 Tax=Pseudonocardia xishanensis TaxID=630995 RepID=UPI003CD07880
MTAAAEQLGYSPSAVSQQLRRLKGTLTVGTFPSGRSGLGARTRRSVPPDPGGTPSRPAPRTG